MRVSQIMKIFGLNAYTDKELETDDEILHTIENCKKLTDSMNMEEYHRRKENRRVTK